MGFISKYQSQQPDRSSLVPKTQHLSQLPKESEWEEGRTNASFLPGGTSKLMPFNTSTSGRDG